MFVVAAGCATVPVSNGASPGQAIPLLRGSYHQVRRGETLWRIARSYGLDVRTLASVNRIPHSQQLKVGQRLFIPLPPESGRFLWPMRGMAGSAGISKGLRIAAPSGSLVRASRSGRVAVATRDLAGWGKTVLLDHADGYVTIYANLERILVTPGSYLRQGIPLGSVGSMPLHFEIRYGVKSTDPLSVLPAN